MHLGRLYPQQPGNGLGSVVDLGLGVQPGLMVRVRVARAAALHRAKPRQHPFVHRGVGGIIQMHNNPLSINCFIAIFINSADQNGIFARCSLRMLLVR